MITVAKMFKFDAAHHLPNHEGKCATLHGHTFSLKIEVQGEVDPNTGMIIDFGVIKSTVNKHIIDRLDHSYLNDFVKNPTAENLIEWIRQELSKSGLYSKYSLPVKIVRIQLWETSTSYAEWKA